MDHNGRRVGFQSSLLESERLREEIGRIPVPLGYCTEQHNVRALGAHCPFSHQCLGCEHFRTDPSHLPDLYAYLERLLETRERLRVAVPQLAEWARTKAIPADAEIRTVRTLIRASEQTLNELAPAERAKLLELFRVLRATRARMDGAIAIDEIAGTRNPEATVIARRAGVHRSFVSNHFAAQIAHAQAEIQSRFIAGLAGQTALSAVSLRVEMETAKHKAREEQIEIRALKTRLARSLGEEIASKHPEHSVATATVQDLRAQIGQLLSGQDELRRELRDTEEELEAARRLNRTLVRERNSDPT